MHHWVLLPGGCVAGGTFSKVMQNWTKYLVYLQRKVYSLIIEVQKTVKPCSIIYFVCITHEKLLLYNNVLKILKCKRKLP